MPVLPACIVIPQLSYQVPVACAGVSQIGGLTRQERSGLREAGSKRSGPATEWLIRH